MNRKSKVDWVDILNS